MKASEKVRLGKAIANNTMEITSFSVFGNGALDDFSEMIKSGAKTAEIALYEAREIETIERARLVYFDRQGGGEVRFELWVQGELLAESRSFLDDVMDLNIFNPKEIQTRWETEMKRIYGHRTDFQLRTRIDPSLEGLKKRVIKNP